MASSSSSFSILLESKYDVFLSFRGEDTRDNFISHLYAALCQKHIQTFIDDDGLKRGDEISPVLLKAIEESKISVIIFSKDYASSTWCLEELVKILECKHKNAQMVIPVFYHVNPSDVRKQTGSFKNAFVKHEECLKEMSDKIQMWRIALTEAANLSGWDSSVIRLESKLVDEVVKDILTRLNDMSSSSDCRGLVGLISRIKKIKSLLCIGSSDFRVVGIWGMGGIGKTTLADTIYHQVFSQFEGRCFIINVRQESEKHGLIHVREQVISQVLGENIKISSLSIPQYIQERIQRKKVIIVLDDVSSLEQLELLVGEHNQFCAGSRIIITTRNKQLLGRYGEDNIYEVEEFDYDESLQIFCINAFKQNHPLEDFGELSREVISYAKGYPLALKVLGSFLCGKSKEFWEKARSNLKMISSTEINKVLKISYDSLNREEKNIFLDIACFFKGDNIYDVTKILDGCYNFSAHFCLMALVDKSLILESYGNKLEMHDVLQEMGQEIVYQESEKKPEERSRLWYHDDVYRLFVDNKGADSIEGIFLNMSKIRDLRLSSQAFAKMTNLRLLKFYNHKLHAKHVDASTVHLPRGLKYLPNELRYLHWERYPLKKLPSKFSLENIVKLALPHSKLKQLWKGTKHPSKLKFIDLHDSKCLIAIPNLSDATGLEVMNLQNCRSLVHLSIPYFNKLHTLNLRGCESFRSFSGNIHFRSLVTLDLSSCVKLKRFPQISGNIKHLNLSGTAIEEIPPSIACLGELVELDMKKCTRLKCLSTNICKLKSLTKLNLSDCSRLASFPEILEQMECLETLELNGATSIKELPSSIEYLNGLVNLELRNCENLETIPRSIWNLTSLRKIDVSGCSKLGKLPENLENSIYLEEFNASRTAISQIPSFVVAHWKQIRILKLAFCKLTEIPKDLCCMSSLEVLHLSGNNFNSLPASIKQLSHLEELLLNNCDMLQSFPKLPLYLRILEAMDCKQLRSLPTLMPQSSLDASKLKRPHFFPWRKQNFLFINSLKLNENEYNRILADSQELFQDMATAYHYDEVIYETRISTICLPGSKIPDWISYQSSGDFLTIEVPQHWLNRGFLGFVLGVVIGFERSYDVECLDVKCSAYYETKDGRSFQQLNHLTFASSKVLIESELLLLGYLFTGIIVGEYRTLSFRFRTTQYCEVKYCGASPLYVQSNQAKSSISVEKLDTLI